MATAPTMTAMTLEGPALTAAPVNGAVVPVFLGTLAELEPAATPGVPPAGAVAAACAGAGPA